MHYFRDDKKVFLNPGSLGCNDKPAAPYAIITFTEGKMEIALKEAKYDNTAFLESYSTLKVPEREFILKVFHGDQLK